MALDSVSKALLQSWAAAGPNPTPLWQLDAVQARAAAKRKALQRDPGPAMARCEDVLIPVRDGASIPARLLVPTEQPRGLLVYPVTDADFKRASYHERENQTFLSTPSMNWFWDQYVADSSERMHPDASPLRAKDLSDVIRSPPASSDTAAV